MEAQIVAQAGRKGAVTISTNMAGRGTDIVLGGNAEAMAHAEIPEGETDPRWSETVERFKAQSTAEREEVLAAGGLHIIGTERHESRRIDNQLRGRAGPAILAERFYISLEDDLPILGDKLTVWMTAWHGGGRPDRERGESRSRRPKGVDGGRTSTSQNLSRRRRH